MESTVHLQGVGLHEAIPANHLRAGMHIVYNYGITAEVIGVAATKSGKSITVTTRSSKSGEEYIRRYLRGTFVAVKKI